MIGAGQRGILLLPVALTLAVGGALAYAMTRDGGMSVDAVEAEYDTDVARYLAEAGLNLAKWQNEKLGCGSNAGFGTVSLPGGRIVASDGDINWTGTDSISVSLAASSTRGASYLLDGRSATVHVTNPSEVTLTNGGSHHDSYIREGLAGAQGGTAYLEASDGKAHPLLSFSLPLDVQGATILRAELKLTQTDSKSTQPDRSLAVHRLTRAWSDASATWLSPWGAPGGDYVTPAVASVAIAGNTEYVWRVDALVDGWASGAVPNYGVLLKPAGLLDARFGSFEGSGGTRPQLVVRYLPRCSLLSTLLPGLL
jgi:hypothetical protein